MSTEQPQGFDPAAFVRVDRSALLDMGPIDRFRTCQAIRSQGINDQIDDLRAGAVLELADRYGRIHGTNTKVAKLLGVTGAFVGRLLDEADANAETHEQIRARLDREDVQDITAAPEARLRAVQELEQTVQRFLPGTVADAERGEFDAALIMLKVLQSSVEDTVRILVGQADQGRLEEARAIEEGQAPHQEHTYRMRLSYRNKAGEWALHSVRGWEAMNDFTIAEIAEDAGWIVTGLQERQGESTPGRVWRIELWSDRDGTGEADYTHEHVEHTPTKAERVGWEVTRQATDTEGNVDIAMVRRLMAERFSAQDGEGE